MCRKFNRRSNRSLGSFETSGSEGRLAFAGDFELLLELPHAPHGLRELVDADLFRSVFVDFVGSDLALGRVEVQHSFVDGVFELADESEVPLLFNL